MGPSSRFGPRRRALLAALLAGGGAVAAGCAGAGSEPERTTLELGPVVIVGEAPEAGSPPVRQMALLEALRDAILEMDDEVAWSLVWRLRATGIQPELEEILAGFERILVGRELVGSLELALVRESEPGSNAFRLVLEIRNTGARRMTLRLPPPDLKRLVVGLSPTGVESRVFSRHLAHGLEQLELGPGQLRQVELLRDTLEAGSGLAVRERWRLEPRAGEILVDEVSYPAQGLPVVQVDGRTLAPYLPAEPLPPAELARYVQLQEVFVPGVLERAVRIAPEEREAALDLLTDVVVALDRSAPERLQAIDPALRWLAHRSEPGTDWADWLVRRRRRQGERTERAALDLPLDPRRRKVTAENGR